MSGLAAVYHISGNAPGSEFGEVTILQYKDLFSRNLEVLQSEQIDHEGNFSFTIDAEENSLIVLRIKSINAQFYLSEGVEEYSLTFDVSKANKPLKFDNTNWCAISFSGLEEKDINKRLEHLNRFHAKFYNEYSSDIYQVITQPSSHLKKSLSSSDKRIDMVKLEESPDSIKQDKNLANDLVTFYSEALFSAGVNPTNEDFVSLSGRYMLAELESLLGKNQEDLFNTYLNGKFYPENPEFVSFYTSFYSNCLEEIYAVKSKEKFIKYLYESDLDSALIEAKSILKFPHETLELSLLSSVDMGLDLPSISNRDLTVLIELIARSDRGLSGQVAQAILTNYYKGKKGYEPENIKVLDLEETLHESKNWTGEIVLLSFFTTWNTESTGHLVKLKQLESKYGNQIKFVSVCMDYDWNNFKEFLIDHRNYDWLFLFGNTDKMIKEKLGVKSIPYYVLLDPAGKFMLDYTPTPEENLEQVLARALRTN